MAATTWSLNDIAAGAYLSQLILPSGSRTTTQTSEDYFTYNAVGLQAYLNMTVVGTGSVTLTIQGKDAAGVYYPLLVGAAVITNVGNKYTIFPAATAVANATVNDILPPIIRFVVTANNANPATYSLGMNLGM